MEDYRDYFKTLLESTYVSSTGSDESIICEMMSFLEKVIAIIPDKLYRYRRIDEDGRTIKSFEEGTIPLCTSKCFSDKYDSMIYVDSSKIKTSMKTGLLDGLFDVIDSIKRKDPSVRAEKATRLCYFLEQGLSERAAAERMMEEKYGDYLNDCERAFKQWESHYRESERTARIACFTESIQSKFMWDTYAGGYQGFALEYNLKEFLLLCLKKSISAYVFPVIYTEERPDLTDSESNSYFLNKAAEKGWLKQFWPFGYRFKYNLLSPFKPFLYKDREEYGHEKEWRILYYKENCCENHIEMSDEGCLKAIYYGLDIKKEDYENLHRIALDKGIKEYRVSIDNSGPKYSLKVTSL